MRAKFAVLSFQAEHLARGREPVLSCGVPQETRQRGQSLPIDILGVVSMERKKDFKW